MAKVFITRKIPEVGPNLLKQAGFEVEISPQDEIISREDLLKKVRGADAILSILTDKIDGQVMDAAGPQLKIVANFAMGFDNLDVAAAKQRNIILTNTPDVLTESVAEHTIALMFAISRRIIESDQFMRDGKYTGWQPMLFLGNDLVGKTLGLVGLGRIGAAVAKRMHDGFEMKIIYYDVKRNEELEKKYNLEYKELNDVLKESDYISIHVPLLESTQHLIGEPQFKMMKKTAYLINTSRGPVIDENALVAALKNGEIKGAALDVYENEPKAAPGLTELPNTVLTPHIASATEETRSAMSILAAKNIIAVLTGQSPLTQVKI
jgi:glyoxylate reductase